MLPGGRRGSGVVGRRPIKRADPPDCGRLLLAGPGPPARNDL